MRRDDALRILREHLGELRALGALDLTLIGSVARDDARTDSDVDLLVELAPGMGLREYMGLKFRLEALLGRPVDLVTRDALRPHQRAAIEPDRVHVA
jgi:predicted nucleotidyltransferase